MPHLSPKEAVLPKPRDPSSLFDGCWTAPIGLQTGTVWISQRKVWWECQLVAELKLVGSTKCVLILQYDDVRGELSADNRTISWNDGDKWVRVSEEGESTEEPSVPDATEPEATEDEEQRSPFDGAWEVSSLDASGSPSTVVVTIARQKVLWHDGQVTPLTIIGSQCAMVMDGQNFGATLSADGCELTWSDGDTWCRSGPPQGGEDAATAEEPSHDAKADMVRPPDEQSDASPCLSQPERVLAAARVLGSSEVGDADVPADWEGIARAKDLFVTGLGGFDVGKALQAFRENKQQLAAVPDVKSLQSFGYMMKYFAEVKDGMHFESLRRILLTPDAKLAKYVIRHAAFWADAKNCNRVDEIERFLESAACRALATGGKDLPAPSSLLKSLAKEQKLSAHTLIEFDHLRELFPSVQFPADEAQTGVTKSDGDFELELLQNSLQVLQVAEELNNCAATYVPDIRRKRCALVVLKKVSSASSKACALGEWDLYEQRWSQVSEHNDEPVRPSWQRYYDNIVGRMPEVRSWLMLESDDISKANDEEDAVAIFQPDAQDQLREICQVSLEMGTARQGEALVADGFAVSQAMAEEMKWHPEAAGAMLVLAAAAGWTCTIASSLLECRADPEVMTAGGWSPLMLSTVSGDVEMVNMLLEVQVDVNTRGAGGYTALMLAASHNKAKLLQRFIDHRADVDVVARSNGKTALLLAVECGDVAAADLLLEAAAQVDVQRHDGKSALMLACGAVHGQRGIHELVRSLLARKACVDLLCNDSGTALQMAAKARQWPCVMMLANARAEVNAAKEQQSVLSAAVMGKQLDVVRCLVESEANLEETFNGLTPISMAARSRDWDMVRVLVEVRAALDTSSGSPDCSPLLLAVEAQQLALAERLICARADVSLPLQAAASGGHVSTVQHLVSLRAELHGRAGLTALQAATTAKRWPVAEELLSLRADVGGHAEQGMTPVMAAALHGQSKLLRHLMEQRAELDVRDPEGMTALALAAKLNKWPMVRLLVSGGASLEAAADGLQSPVLVLAMQQREWDAIFDLVKHGAEVDVPSDQGKTALMHAAEAGIEDLVHYLVKCEADVNAACHMRVSVLGRAAMREQESLMRFLVHRGARLTDKDKDLVGSRMCKLVQDYCTSSAVS